MSDIKIGIAGMGAIGRTVARALINGIEGYALAYASDKNPPPRDVLGFDVEYVDFPTLAARCDMVIEALPPTAVPELTRAVFLHEKDLILISSAALLLFPEILAQKELTKSRIIVPSGALCGLDAVSSLRHIGITSARIATTKPPKGYENAPHIVDNKIDLLDIKVKTKIFSGNAREAAKAFPANLNVAASLSLAGIGPEQTQVEAWVDPDSSSNVHEIEVISNYSRITSRVENQPDPKNPKTSVLAAQSIVSVLKKMNSPITVL